MIYSAKQQDFIDRRVADDPKLSILCGSFRSGKTMALGAKMTALSKYAPDLPKLIVGVSVEVLAQCFLREIPPTVKWVRNDSHRKVRISESEWTLLGIDEKPWNRFLGAETLFGVVCVIEGSLVPQELIQNLRNRLVSVGRMYIETNPGEPDHWLKRTIDSGHPDIEHWHFSMDDNPNLNEDYKRYMRTTLTVSDFKRFVLGQWVIDEKESAELPATP